MGDALQPNPDGTFAMPEVVWIPLGNLEDGPSYRTQFRRMEELENSIRQFGVLTPLWVEPDPKVDNRYLIFAGHRRFEAAKRVARERCDPSPSFSVAAQVAKYVIPCRVFRDLPRVHQGLLSLTENGVRHDPSAIDVGRELLRLKRLMESENGRPAKIEDILTLLGGKGSDRKCLGRRQIYRLLRIGEFDEEVAAAAKERHLANNFLDHVARLPEKSEQLELIGLIGDVGLTRQEVRDIVNRRLSTERSELSSIVAEVRASAPVSFASTATSALIASNGSDGQKVERLADDPAGDSRVSDGEVLAATTPAGDPVQRLRATASVEPTNLKDMVSQLRSQADVVLLRGADVLEAWAVGEGERLKPGAGTLNQWLVELAERGHDGDVIARLRDAVQKEEYSEFEAQLMKLFYEYQGILPEHLPSYVRQIREAMAESGWYQRLVRCSLELFDLLDRLDESKKVNAMARRLVDIVFHEIFWRAAEYDPKLRYQVQKLPSLKKKEFVSFWDL